MPAKQYPLRIKRVELKRDEVKLSNANFNNVAREKNNTVERVEKYINQQFKIELDKISVTKKIHQMHFEYSDVAHALNENRELLKEIFHTIDAGKGVDLYYNGQ